jgi:hypothetical protein
MTSLSLHFYLENALGKISVKHYPETLKKPGQENIDAILVLIQCLRWRLGRADLRY